MTATFIVDADDENDAVEIAEDRILSGDKININEAYACEAVFKTSDGFILKWDGEAYTDGDLRFNADDDGFPVDHEGNEVPGDFHES